MSVTSSPRSRGQGLVEAIVGIGAISAATAGIVTLVTLTIKIGRTSNQEVIALGLAREAIEVARGIRDTNWLRIQANEDVDALTSGIQLAGTFVNHVPSGALDLEHTIYDPTSNQHAEISIFDGGSNTWSVLPLAVGAGFSSSAACAGSPCSNVYTNPVSGEYRQSTSGAGTGAPTLFQRLLEVDPICRADADANGIPDVSSPAERIVGAPQSDGTVLNDGTGCTTGTEILVGVRVLALVRWTDLGGTRTEQIEDRLYNWKYVQ